MTTTINRHGEKETTIGTVKTPTGRGAVKVVEFVSCGRPCFALQVEGRFGGHPDARRFSTQVKRAKAVYGDASNEAEWVA